MPYALRHPASKENETRSDNSAGNTPEIKNAPKPVMTVPEAAEVLGISRTLAYDLIARHELPAVRPVSTEPSPAPPVQPSTTSQRKRR